MRPATIEEASALLAEATAQRRRVRIGDDLSADGLDRVLEHEAGDLTCTVEAGIRLSALQSRLAASGQRLSLDPPGDPTVGACLARRLSGPLSHRFGTPRDLVLGVTLVLGDGTIASSGGKVVKNFAGYDLGKLVCGSEGRLALIARVSLRLHPVPAASGTLVVETDEAPAIVRALRRSQLDPSALDAPRLVVASASKPDIASNFAVPASHGFGMMNAPSRSCSARNAAAFWAWVFIAGILDPHG